MLDIDKLWFVIANASQAYLYQYEKVDKNFKKIAAFSHPQSRLKKSELVTDKEGYFKQAAEPIEDTYESATDPKKEEANRFAKELATTLYTALNHGEFNQLVFIGPGHLQHYFRQHCAKPVERSIRLFVDKDYTKIGEDKLNHHMKELLKH